MSAKSDKHVALITGVFGILGIVLGAGLQYWLFAPKPQGAAFKLLPRAGFAMREDVVAAVSNLSPTSVGILLRLNETGSQDLPERTWLNTYQPQTAQLRDRKLVAVTETNREGQRFFSMTFTPLGRDASEAILTFIRLSLMDPGVQ